MLGENLHRFYERLAEVKKLGYYFLLQCFFTALHDVPLSILQKGVLAFDHVAIVGTLHRRLAFENMALEQLLNCLLTLIYMT